MSDVFPPATRHSLPLKDGRSLAYYTWDGDNELDGATTNSRHPVLYVHGFPAAGMEGQICARQVAQAGGQLFAMDRPGMGYSDHYPSSNSDNNNTTANDAPDGDGAVQNLKIFVSDTWEFVHEQKWSAFSIIGVSGGGPFTLALLTSWLEHQQRQKNSTNSMRLINVAFVAGVCVSAGVQDMTEENRQMFGVVKNAPTSKFSRCLVRTMMAIPSLMVGCLPTSWMVKMIPTSGLPQSDKDFLQDDKATTALVELSQLAFRQGSLGPFHDACIVLRANQEHEEVLKKMYSGTATSSSSSLPRVGIFQGDLDVDVPKSHALYVHKELLSEKASLHIYEELGHVSMVHEKAEDYAKFAVSN